MNGFCLHPRKGDCMADEFWFKFNFKDWADDVKPLSLKARGLLIELIIYMRKNNGEIIIDIPLIVRLTGGLTEEITESLTEFKTFAIFDFQILDGKEIMISRKIKKALHKSLVNRENGNKGGNPRLSMSVNRSVNPTSNSNSNSISKYDFDSFYNAYAKKIGKREKLEKKWYALTEDEREAIMKYIPAYVESTPDKKFRKNPETFLNNKSWNDEIIVSGEKKQTSLGTNKVGEDFSEKL